MPELDLLNNPIVALSIGAFGALLLIGLVRKARILFMLGVLGITLTIGLIVVKMGL